MEKEEIKKRRNEETKMVDKGMKIVWFCFLYTALINGQDNFANSLGIEFVRIPAGEFRMGRFQPTVSRMISWGSNEPLNETIYQEALEKAKHDAVPGFQVKINAPFYIGKYEITQAQWKKIMGNNPAYYQQSKVDDKSDLHPVENITYRMALRFVHKLNRLEKGKALYRLPTEFEWEYAARAGKQDDISWSEIQASAVIARQSTSRVGQKRPNAWGIYDMLGNVWEWTQDYYNEKIFADPVPPNHGKQHVLKGASFFGDVKNATYMTHAAGPGSGYDVGLRLVMELKK
jgi:formylglycine-generating enzyme required for sulfatase activity